MIIIMDVDQFVTAVAVIVAIVRFRSLSAVKVSCVSQLMDVRISRFYILMNIVFNNSTPNKYVYRYR